MWKSHCTDSHDRMYMDKKGSTCSNAKGVQQVMAEMPAQVAGISQYNLRMIRSTQSEDRMCR